MQFDPSFFLLEVLHVGALKLSVCNCQRETKPERHTNSVICSKVVEVLFGGIDRPLCLEVRQRNNNIADASFDGESFGIAFLSI